MDRAPTSFDAFVTESGTSPLRIAHLITLDHGKADDLGQDCFLESARRWLTSVRWTSRSLTRVARARASGVPRVKTAPSAMGRAGRIGWDLAESADAIDLVGVRIEMFDALRALTVRQRIVLALRYFHDLSETQVADALGCSVGTVRSTTHQGLAQLRAAIDNHEPSQPGSEK